MWEAGTEATRTKNPLIGQGDLAGLATGAGTQHFASQRLRLSGKSPRSLEELRNLSYPQCAVDKLVVLTSTAAMVLTTC